MAIAVTPSALIYPTSDGQPMADNTRQFRWIVTIQGGFEALYKDRPNVFVAGDLLWYPVEGNPRIRRAPDTMIVFGRPKGDRGAYLQWEEEHIAPQVVFEILSPGNTVVEMAQKQRFYEQYGVEEYYVYDPDHGELAGWLRQGGVFNFIEQINGWCSPRLGVTFTLSSEGELIIEQPNGRRFLSYLELERERNAAREQAEAEAARAEAEAARAEAEAARAEAEAARAEAEAARAARLAARLRALGIDPESEAA